MNRESVRAAVFGHAVGDAFGVPLEFLSRAEVRALNLTEMVGKESNPPIHSRWGTIIPKGAFSDDTSMMIAGMESLARVQGIDYDDIMINFLNWWNAGEFCSTEQPFGIGGNVSQALQRYLCGLPALECGGKQRMDNGNGALMRILPFSFYAIARDMPFEERVDFIGKASSLTHGHDISKLSCMIYTEWMDGCLQGMDKQEALRKACAQEYGDYYESEAIGALRRVLSLEELTESNVTGKGYVVATLEAVIYSILHSEDYRSAILTASQLGDDVDTVCAVTGALAGILYGEQDIPENWILNLKKKDMLAEIADKFSDFIL